MDLRLGQILIIVAAVAFVISLFFQHLERRRRLEIIHQERLAAIEKGVPLPELPIDPPSAATGRPADEHFPLFIGLVLATFGVGSMAAFLLTHSLAEYMFLPLPFVFMGVGLLLYSVLTKRRGR